MITVLVHFLKIVHLVFLKLFGIVFGDFIVCVCVFFFNGFHRKDLDGLKFICGYLITFCSIILLLIIYKTGYASKSLVWVWGVTIKV